MQITLTYAYGWCQNDNITSCWEPRNYNIYTATMIRRNFV